MGEKKTKEMCALLKNHPFLTQLDKLDKKQTNGRIFPMHLDGELNDLFWGQQDGKALVALPRFFTMNVTMNVGQMAVFVLTNN